MRGKAKDLILRFYSVSTSSPKPQSRWREHVESVDFFSSICHAETVKEKGFTLPLVLVVVAVVLVIVGGVALFQIKSKSQTRPQSLTPTESTPKLGEEDKIDNWRVYFNSRYNFQFSYPEKFYLTEVEINEKNFFITVTNEPPGGGVIKPSSIQFHVVGWPKSSKGYTTALGLFNAVKNLEKLKETDGYTKLDEGERNGFQVVKFSDSRSGYLLDYAMHSEKFQVELRAGAFDKSVVDKYLPEFEKIVETFKFL